MKATEKLGGIEGVTEYYMQGSCHELALALHKNLGWPMLVVEHHGEPYWEDEEDPDNYIPTVLHVYAIDPAGNAWDIKGIRHELEVIKESSEEFGTNPQDLSTEIVNNEGELRFYVGYDEETGIDKPLTDYNEEDISLAFEIAQEVFETHPAWPLKAQPALKPKTFKP